MDTTALLFFFPPSSFAINSMTKQKMLLLYVPIHHFRLFCFFFVFFYEPQPAYSCWCGSGGAPDTVVNMLSSGLHHLQLLSVRRSGRWCRVSTARQKSFIFLTAKLVPASLLCTCACHNTFVQMLHGEQNTVSHFVFLHFFFLTQENGLVKLVGWNILMVGDVDITSADMFFIFFIFFCRDYWHLGPNNSMTWSA